MRKSRRLTTGIVTVVAMAGLGACSGGSSSDEPTNSSAKKLTQQRDDVRKAMAEVTAEIEEALPARRSNPTGKYTGCGPDDGDTFEAYQYQYDVRLDVSGFADKRPYTDRMRDALLTMGFEAGRPTRERGFAIVRGTRDGVTAVFADQPSAGNFVLLRIGGPCVKIPAEDSNYWLRYIDDEPLD